jgi:hypothetical protein
VLVVSVVAFAEKCAMIEQSRIQRLGKSSNAESAKFLREKLTNRTGGVHPLAETVLGSNSIERYLELLKWLSGSTLSPVWRERSGVRGMRYVENSALTPTPLPQGEELSEQPLRESSSMGD